MSSEENTTSTMKNLNTKEEDLNNMTTTSKNSDVDTKTTDGVKVSADKKTGMVSVDFGNWDVPTITSSSKESKALNALSKSVGKGLKKGLTTLIVFIGILIFIALFVLILLTVLGHKARMRCIDSYEYPSYSGLTIFFLVFLWLGGMVPVVGGILGLMGFVGTIVMIVLSKKCD